MNTRNLIKRTRRSLLPLLFLLLTPASRLAAQEVSPTLVTNPPAFGTFYWLSGLPPVPHPFDPARGLLPLWSFNGAYYVDDSELLQNLFDDGMMSAMDAPGPPPCDCEPDTNAVPCFSLTNFVVSYASVTNMTTRLGLSPTATNVNVRITTTNTNWRQDLFGTVNLAPLPLPECSQTNWVWLVRGHGSTTNFSWGETNWCQRYFQTGDLTDSDNDGLTDAYEKLVSHTATNVANSPRSVYEDVISSQNPNNWFKLNNDGTNGLTNAISGQTVTTLASSGLWDVDAFATGNNSVEFNGNTQRLTAGDVTGTNQGSMSLLFRSLPSHPTNNLTTPRYVFCQRGNLTNEWGLFFEPTNATAGSGSLKLQIGGQTNILLASNAVVFGTWYYLAVTWNESIHLATCYLAPIGGSLGTTNFTFGATNAFGNSSNVVFGNRQNAGGNYTNAFRIPPGNGALDQIAFWNRQLTGTEICAQFDRLNELFQGPAKVFDLSRWNILLPVNRTNELNPSHAALEIHTGWLNTGFKYLDPTNWTQKYFYLSNGSQMVFEAPWNGARSSTNAGPRSELRETTLEGNRYNWQPFGTNTLEATCTVESAGTNNSKKLIIGQIHSDIASDPPITINYNFPNSKDLSVTYKLNPTNSADDNLILATNVNVLDSIHYKVQLFHNGTEIRIYADASVNGTPQTAQDQKERLLTPYSAWQATTFYFKAGCYYPSPTTNSSAKVTFSSLTATHQP